MTRSFLSLEIFFIPYLTLTSTFIPNMTPQSIPLANDVKCLLKRPFCPSSSLLPFRSVHDWAFRSACTLGACRLGIFPFFFHARWAHAWLPFSFLIFFIIFVQHIFQAAVYHHFFQYLYNIFYNMSTTFFQQIHKHFFNKPTTYSSPLPETGCLLSARMFTECILSGTRQNNCTR